MIEMVEAADLMVGDVIPGGLPWVVVAVDKIDWWVRITLINGEQRHTMIALPGAAYPVDSRLLRAKQEIVAAILV